jgi:hypothetical protein
MNNELKPCPFCGGEARLIGHSPYSITCCKCRATTVICDTPEKAINEWNRRVQPTFTPDELDAIRRMFRDRYPRAHELPEIEQSIIRKCNYALARREQ